MALEDLGPRLHDRATRGQALSQEEEISLQAWYEQMNRAEIALIVHAPEQDASLLQQQVDTALSQLVNTTQHIRRLARENAALRRENARLRQQLASQAAPQPV